MSTSLHVLTSAIEDRREALLRCGSDSERDGIRLRFMAGGRWAWESGLWAETSSAEAGRIDRLIAAQSPVHVSFTSGHQRLYFDTTILQRRRLFRRGERLLLAWPAALRVAERRRAGRLPVGEHTAIVARLRGGEHLPDVPLQIHDLDERGASFVLEPAHLPPADDALHVCMSFAGVDHWVVASVRHRQPLADGRLRLGVEFDVVQAQSLRASEWFARAMDDLRACRGLAKAERAA